MKTEEEIRNFLKDLKYDLEHRLEKRKTYYIGKMNGMKEALEWVLDLRK